MTPYDPLRDEHLVAIALRAVLESDLQCHDEWSFEHGDWAPDGTYTTAWSWADTRRELAYWQNRIQSGTEYLMESDDVTNAMPLVTGMSQHDIAHTLYEAIAAQIDRMTYEQVRIMVELPR